VNGAKGHSVLQFSRDLDCQYKTAFALARKIREALAIKLKMKPCLAKSRNRRRLFWWPCASGELERKLPRPAGRRYLSAYASEMAWGEDNRRKQW